MCSLTLKWRRRLFNVKTSIFHESHVLSKPRCTLISNKTFEIPMTEHNFYHKIFTFSFQIFLEKILFLRIASKLSFVNNSCLDSTFLIGSRYLSHFPDSVPSLTVEGPVLLG